jgi:peptidyl-prolyl cis-trans isomerase B (cyclophilin B)
MMTLIKRSTLSLTLILCVCAVACSSPSSTPSSSTAADDEIAVIETDFGKIKIRFFPDVAPKHVAHFKQLTREGFYDGLAFHRVIPNGIIQGGDPTTRGDNRDLWGKGEPGQPTVPAEFSNKPFVRGTVGAARKGDDNNSATSQFFICLSANPSWNGQYTVFGEVIEGLNVAQIISNAPRDPATIDISDLVQEKALMRRVYLEKAGAPQK